MTTNQPTIEERLSRLETLFVNVGEKVAEHDGNIDVLVANIQQLTENVSAVNQRVDALTANVNILAEQAAQDRQQAAIDRQEFRNSVNQILNYLRDRNGGSPPPQI
ncbi:hypothetical protein F7734_13750 [Scytonema sp. UIC 10036]|uniref:hypothetical protein n=1 Tax=Scytonema sp. UIC 10036 TaxID=2304196 RepID=UPI0012DA8D8F|nr:hypothetical protein [Scytonema sp. UIC 10036]MUG93436.1 hypothetical protein [Scytonema sp. UIC 10036]